MLKALQGTKFYVLSKVKSISFDNGWEFASHDVILKELKCRIFFADPYCSYQRGTSENTNGLIRQYFPKGSDFDLCSDKEVRRVMNRFNSRPRKRLDFFSPLEKLSIIGVALNSLI